MLIESISEVPIAPGPIGERAPPRAVFYWLIAVCVLLALMVMVGGATRLTHSGLSITEWRPVTGVVPPLSSHAWAQEFDKYKAIPQFRLRNPNMSPEQFETIYWWEWSHRLLGRLIGIVLLLPVIWFALRREIDRRLGLRLGLIFLLGGLQGALGWYMVKSGLSDRIDVSQYRLAAHLGLAFAIFGLTIWTALDLAPAAVAPHAAPRWLRSAAMALAGLVFVQVLLGGLVAGLKAGFIANTWPLMDGRFWPPDYWRLAPAYTNWGENPVAVQFDHRLGAYIIIATVSAIWLAARPKTKAAARRALDLLAALVVCQLALGIATLLEVVPLGLALAHQGLALAVFAASLNLVRVTPGRSASALAFP